MNTKALNIPPNFLETLKITSQKSRLRKNELGLRKSSSITIEDKVGPYRFITRKTQENEKRPYKTELKDSRSTKSWEDITNPRFSSSLEEAINFHYSARDELKKRLE